MTRPHIAKVQIKDLQNALQLFRDDVDRYPTTDEGLEALMGDPGVPGWDGPYLSKRKLPHDPWNRTYHYRSPGVHGAYDLWSYAADGVQGGEGLAEDVVSW